MNNDIILGAGVTGLAAGVVSGLPIYEAEEHSGGICSSYYLRLGDPKRLLDPPADGEAYRFEIGGGHWIFGADQEALDFIRPLSTLKTYERLSAVYFPDQDLYVPYPIQNHLSFLPQELAQKALAEIMHDGQEPTTTLAEWLQRNFGKTLCDMFFLPFHELYAAGLQNQIAPQDPHKSPLNKTLILKGAKEKTPAVGYNATFVYPGKGLNDLVNRMAGKCTIHFNKKVVAINVDQKSVHFADGTAVCYDKLLSTLPLNRLMKITGFGSSTPPDPYTSVLVLNIGAVRGPKCPEEHWIYIPQSRSGFHRVGFYSNVDASFLPKSSRHLHNRVSIYVERSFRAGDQPDSLAVRTYETEVVRELQSWGFIEAPEVIDATWIPIAYTWSRPASPWRDESLKILAGHNIYQVGRYARWKFQGIAESIKDGLKAGSTLKHQIK
ncbi:MAG: protoporphyrinogen/coproporphyrinogen oxidase [Desulfobaccales bacterium]